MNGVVRLLRGNRDYTDVELYMMCPACEKLEKLKIDERWLANPVIATMVADQPVVTACGLCREKHLAKAAKALWKIGIDLREIYSGMDDVSMWDILRELEKGYHEEWSNSIAGVWEEWI